MTDRLTLKQLKAELDTLTARVEGLDPLAPSDDHAIASVVDVEEFERVRSACADLGRGIDELRDVATGQSRMVDELRESASADMRDALDRIDTAGESLAQLRADVERISAELAEANEVVNGLRADARTDLTARETEMLRIQEMRAQMDGVFQRMVKVEQSVVVDEERDTRFRREIYNESLLACVVAGVSAGVAIVIMALALAGMI